MSTDASTRKELIIIDDDKPTTNYNLRLAEHTGCFTAIHTFNSAETAIEFLTEKEKNSNAFDGSIIVDVYMDEMDGLEFLDEVDDLELVSPTTEILVLTAKNSLRSREKTESSFLRTCFAIKPLTEQQILSLVGKHE